MSVIWGLIPTKLKLYGALALAVVAAFAWTYFVGRRDEAAERRVKELRDSLNAVRKAKEVRDEVEALDDNDLTDRASKYVRRGR